MVEKGVSCRGLKLSPGLPWYICSPFPRYHAIQGLGEDTSKLSRPAYLTMTRPCLKIANQMSPLACRLFGHSWLLGMLLNNVHHCSGVSRESQTLPGKMSEQVRHVDLEAAGICHSLI